MRACSSSSSSSKKRVRRPSKRQLSPGFAINVWLISVMVTSEDLPKREAL